MRTPMYRVEPAGFLPLYCFQCQAARCHEVDCVHTRLKRPFSKVAEAPYGYVARCQACELASPIDPDIASVRLESPPALLEEAALELFGEDNAVDFWKVQLEQVQLGIASADERANAIGAVFEAVSEHARLPKFSRKPTLIQSFQFQTAVWAAGSVVASVISLVFSKGPDYWQSVIVTTIGMLLGWSIVCAFAFRGGSGVRPEEVRAESKDITRRLAAGLRTIEPSGHELQRVQEISLRHGLWSGIADPHEVLLKINSLNKRELAQTKAA